MGRYYYDAKCTVEQATQLNIFKLKEFGLLHGGYAATTLTWTYRVSKKETSIGIIVDIRNEPYIRVNYTNTNRSTGKKTDYDYRIDLTTTPCHFGGVRYWFVCPLYRNGGYCGRRTGTLYLSPAGNYFGCRHCHDLSYDSRNECRLGRFAQLGYILKVSRQYEELHKKTKRFFWQGRPTRKARKLFILGQKIDQTASLSKRLVD